MQGNLQVPFLSDAPASAVIPAMSICGGHAVTAAT